MSVLPANLSDQLRARFAERLEAPVRLRLLTRPGTGRLVLPTGYGCATCDDAQTLAEDLVATAPEKLSLEVVDVSAAGVQADVPALEVLLADGEEEARIRFQGLTSGFEFATVVDAVERVSRSEPGLTELSIEALGKVTDPLEVMVFATPT